MPLNCCPACMLHTSKSGNKRDLSLNTAINVQSPHTFVASFDSMSSSLISSSRNSLFVSLIRSRAKKNNIDKKKRMLNWNDSILSIESLMFFLITYRYFGLSGKNGVIVEQSITGIKKKARRKCHPFSVPVYKKKGY